MKQITSDTSLKIKCLEIAVEVGYGTKDIAELTRRAQELYNWLTKEVVTSEEKGNKEA